MSDFRAELEALINKHSMENGSNTPDFILADFLRGTLANFDLAIKARERWYGRDPASGLGGGNGTVPEPVRKIRLATAAEFGNELLKLVGLEGNKHVAELTIHAKAGDLVKVSSLQYMERPEHRLEVDLVEFRMVPEAEYQRLAKAAENWEWSRDE